MQNFSFAIETIKYFKTLEVNSAGGLTEKPPEEI
jgi:hypothetical protein